MRAANTIWMIFFLTGCTSQQDRIDRYEVTVSEFAAFVEETNYTTTAEEIGWSFVARTTQWFDIMPVNWRTPENPSRTAEPEHPITQVSWYDACAFCEWRGGRLPTIAEWASAVNWNKPGNTLDTGNGRIMPAKETDSQLGNVWEWTQEGAVVGGSYLCSVKSCAGFTRREFIHYPGKDAGGNNIGFRCIGR